MFRYPERVLLGIEFGSDRGGFKFCEPELATRVSASSPGRLRRTLGLFEGGADRQLIA